MSPILIGVIALVVLFALFFLNMPIGFAMFLIGFLGIFYVINGEAARSTLAITLYRVASDYNLTLIPFFVLMGEFATVSGISSELFDFADKWLRKLPGGLALATVAGCTAFGAICGSSGATSATLGSVSLPEMRKHRYGDILAAGTVAAGGTLGFLIPPSIGFAIYGVLAEESIGKLFIAGFFPGLLLSILWMVTIISWVKINPLIAPMGSAKVSWRERFISLRNVWTTLVIFMIVMGGIYLGFFTATEAGAVGAMTLFIVALIRKKLTLVKLLDSLKGTTRVSVMILFIIAGAYVFGYFIAATQLTTPLLSFINSLDVSRYLVLVMILVFMLILGCILDVGPLMVLTMPILLPIIRTLGFDVIWFGVICVLMMNAGLITPPVGLNVYITAGIAKDIPMSRIFKGVSPFLIAIIVASVAVTVFPQIALYLPNLMK